MARSYSIPAFFRNAPNALLERYFQKQGLLEDFDFKPLKETQMEPLLEAWFELDDIDRQSCETDFQDIFNLSDEKGIKAIIDEAGFHDPDGLLGYTEWLAAMANHYERAFSTFLDFPAYWKGAVQFFHADSLSQWRKRKHMPKKTANCEPKALNRLATLIGDYFHHTEGRGQHCFIDPLRRGDLDYFFAYPEDYAQRSVEWVGDEFAPRPHNPAFEIIFVYNQAMGSLDVHYKGNRKAVEPLQAFFAEAILGVDELPPVENDTRVYDLDPLRSADFTFVYAAGSGILDVRVRSLRLTSRHKKGDRIILEADYKQDSQAIYHLLKSLTPKLELSQYYVTRVELVASMTLTADKPPKNISFAVTYPNSCSLKYEGEHLILREMLEKSGIEPKSDELDF